MFVEARASLSLFVFVTCAIDATAAALPISTEGATDLIDRPMSEHEGALFDAVQVLATMVLDLGANADVFRARLTAAREAADGLGNTHSAATLDFLIAALFPAPGAPTKPSFRIV